MDSRREIILAFLKARGQASLGEVATMTFLVKVLSLGSTSSVSL